MIRRSPPRHKSPPRHSHHERSSNGFSRGFTSTRGTIRPGTSLVRDPSPIIGDLLPTTVKFMDKKIKTTEYRITHGTSSRYEEKPHYQPRSTHREEPRRHHTSSHDRNSRVSHHSHPRESYRPREVYREGHRDSHHIRSSRPYESHRSSYRGSSSYRGPSYRGSSSYRNSSSYRGGSSHSSYRGSSRRHVKELDISPIRTEAMDVEELQDVDSSKNYLYFKMLFFSS